MLCCLKSHVNFYIENTHNTHKKMEHIQNKTQKIINDFNQDSFSDHFAKYFTWKPSPQKFRKIMYLEILSKVNSID